MPNNKKNLVVSGVNLVEGGTLNIFKECLYSAQKNITENWNIIALVHDANMFGIDGITYIEFPKIKKSWVSRLWFEYVTSAQLSIKLKADYWLAMHDISPRVHSSRQAVYCHNVICFYKMTLSQAIMAPKLFLFSCLYGWLYRVNISANDAVIVQQNWTREKFCKLLGVRNAIVAHPIHDGFQSLSVKKRQGLHFFYPSLPRIFKDFETLLSSWSELEKDSAWRGELFITIDGSENAYTQKLRRQFGHLKRVHFLGCLTYERVVEIYKASDCLVFPSLLESWGLPLSEAQKYGLAIIVSDLPYAHEAVGCYDGVSFFPAGDKFDLARKIKLFSEGKLALGKGMIAPLKEPYADDWEKLFEILL